MSITTTRSFTDLLYVVVVQLLDGPHKMNGLSHYLIMKRITQGFQVNEVGHQGSSQPHEKFPTTTWWTKGKSLQEILSNKGLKFYSNNAPSAEEGFLKPFYFPLQHEVFNLPLCNSKFWRLKAIPAKL